MKWKRHYTFSIRLYGVTVATLGPMRLHVASDPVGILSYCYDFVVDVILLRE